MSALITMLGSKNTFYTAWVPAVKAARTFCYIRDKYTNCAKIYNLLVKNTFNLSDTTAFTFSEKDDFFCTFCYNRDKYTNRAKIYNLSVKNTFYLSDSTAFTFS